MPTYFKLTASKAEIKKMVTEAVGCLPRFGPGWRWGYLHELSNSLAVAFLKRDAQDRGICLFGVAPGGELKFNSLLDPADRKRIEAALPKSLRKTKEAAGDRAG